MLYVLLILFSVVLFERVSCDAPLNNYLPPFAGYPPSRPPVNPFPPPSPPPTFADPEEDLESIVIEAPSFGRNVNFGSTSTTSGFLGARVNSGFGQYSNSGNFAQLPNTYGVPGTQVFNANSNNYVRTNQQTSPAFTLPTPLYAAPTPLEQVNENVRYNLLNTQTTDTSISTYQTPPVVAVNNQFQYRDANNYALNPGRSNAANLSPTYSTYSGQINNQYLPPSRTNVQQNSDGYFYNRPRIPFNF